ncbi:hypothetical protein LTR85_008540 [Meristemomyces frigidus]|nr:hypothetical protein LTR85_008540 [Meristemomyces frigidus]
MGFWQSAFPSASRQRQDSLLQTFDEQKEQRRRRTFSSAKAYLDQLTQQTHEEPCYQPFLPPRPCRESSQQSNADGRRRSLPAVRRETRQPVYAPPYVPAAAPVFKQVKSPGPDIRITRYFTRYTRCCGREWLTGIHFTSIPRTSIGSSRAAAVSPMTDLSLQSNAEEVCYRCRDRLRCSAWHLLQSTPYPETLHIKQVGPAGRVQYAYERQTCVAKRCGARASKPKFVIGPDDDKDDRSGTDADDEDKYEAGGVVQEADSWSSGGETVVPKEEYQPADEEMGEEVNAAAVEAAMCLLGMAKVD